MKRLRLTYPDIASIERDHAANLALARAFVIDVADVGDREICELELVHPGTGATIVLAAEVVWLAPNGAGLALTGFDAAKKGELAAFVAADVAFLEEAGSAPDLATLDAVDPPELIPLDDDGNPLPVLEPLEPLEVADADAEPPELIPLDDDGNPLPILDESEDGQTESQRALAKNPQERVRQMSGRERELAARHGNVGERVALERAFGSSVWEALLANPQLTVPEVARIAKNGTLSKPLVSAIVANGAWISNPEVQRALLSNPRCGGSQLDRVLRAMRPSDLQQLAKQCPYRGEVKSAAQALAKRGAR